jgi:hypothetical protein
MKRTVLHRAMCVTGSWARSWGLHTAVEGGHLMVAGRKVVFRDGREKGESDIVLSAKRVLAKDHDKVQDELKVLAKALRIRKPKAVRKADAKQVAAQGDHEARSMRLTAFARSPNPPEAVLREYLPTIRREADRACRRYRNLSLAMGYSRHDFLNIGMTYAVIYLHRKADIFNEQRNGANLTRYLRQEFGRWYKVTNADMRSIMPDPQGMDASYFMGSPVPGASLGHNIEEGFYTMPEHAQPEPEEPEHDESYYAKRREEAKSSLVQKLGEMPHDKMVDTLTQVAESRYQDATARELAMKLLRKHARECMSCPVPAPAVG